MLWLMNQAYTGYSEKAGESANPTVFFGHSVRREKINLESI
jgi:hypothetical protein